MSWTTPWTGSAWSVLSEENRWPPPGLAAWLSRKLGVLTDVAAALAALKQGSGGG